MKYKKSNCVLILILIVFTANGLHANIDSVFKAGNELYKQMKYDSSVSMYKQLTGQGIENSQVYYNLGNAFYQTKQLDSAKKYFQKSLQLNADNPACQENLALCRKKLNHKLGNGSAMLYKLGLKLNYFSMNQLAIAVYINVFILCVILGLRMNNMNGKTIDAVFRYSKWSLVILVLLVISVRIFNATVHWV